MMKIKVFSIIDVSVTTFTFLAFSVSSSTYCIKLFICCNYSLLTTTPITRMVYYDQQ